MAYPSRRKLVSCSLCGSQIDVPLSSKRKYCSLICSRKGQVLSLKSRKNSKVNKMCDNCGEYFLAFPSQSSRRFCNRKCMSEYKVGVNGTNWRGGIRKERGYVYIYAPEHPHAKNGVVAEHRLVVEKRIGRYLTADEVVHHINEIKNDNRIENLQLTDAVGHRRIHANHEMVPCGECGRLFDITNRDRNRNKRFCGHKCGGIYAAKKRLGRLEKLK